MDEFRRQPTWEERFTRKPTLEPRLELLEVAWRMRAPSGRILQCGIYRTDAGFEARMGYGENLLASHYAASLELARQHAEGFRLAAASNQKFTAVAADVPALESRIPSPELPSIEPFPGGRLVRNAGDVRIQVSGDELAKGLREEE